MKHLNAFTLNIYLADVSDDSFCTCFQVSDPLAEKEVVASFIEKTMKFAVRLPLKPTTS